jgi:hypothetical protein
VTHNSNLTYLTLSKISYAEARQSIEAMSRINPDQHQSLTCHSYIHVKAYKITMYVGIKHQTQLLLFVKIGEFLPQ